MEGTKINVTACFNNPEKRNRGETVGQQFRNNTNEGVRRWFCG